MIKVIVFVWVSSLIFCSCTSKTTKNMTPKTFGAIDWNDTLKPGWVLTFQDEFNEGKLNIQKWSSMPYHGSRYHPGSRVYYCSDKNFEFTDSTIRLMAKKEITTVNDTMHYQYTIGWLDNFYVMDQQYGFFEMRCKLPQGKGMWPAFWLVSRHSWPPEIDIFEIYTSVSATTIESNLHFFKNERHTSNMKKTKIPDARAAFQTYGLNWEPELLTFYFDGLAFRRQKIKKEWFPHPMHITVSTGVDSRNPLFLEELSLPNYLEVDYVRAYKPIHPSYALSK